MELVQIDPVNPDPAVIKRAARVLLDGGVVAFPTETVYGLGANALSESAVQRIYAAKGRPAYNPLIVHVAAQEQARALVRAWPEAAQRLADAFWPGPLTLVLPKRGEIPDAVTAGLDSVAVRVPRHPVAAALLAAAGIPIAAPSANRSTEVSPTTGRHVSKSLGDRVDMVLDAGPVSVGIESTVLDLSGETPTLLRPGTITISELENLVGLVAMASEQPHASPRRSPGMMDKHYAPRAELTIVDSADVGVRVEHERSNVRRVGALVLSSDVEPADTIVRMPQDALAYAARLYDSLHALDDAGCDVIIVERVPDTAAWFGVADRLRRAAFRDAPGDA